MKDHDSRSRRGGRRSSARSSDKLTERSMKMGRDISWVKDSIESKLEDILKENQELLTEAINLQSAMRVADEQRQQLLDRIGEMEGSVEEDSSDLKDLEARLREIDAEADRETPRLREAREQVKTREKEIRAMERELSEHNSKLDALRRHKEVLREEVSQMESVFSEATSESVQMEKKKQRLGDDIERLRELKEEYLGAIRRFKEMKDQFSV